MWRHYWLPSALLIGLALAAYWRYGGEQDLTPTMPGRIDPEEERALYLTPGGRYSESDIRANDGLTASEKFGRFRAQHDFSPEPGDRICPITRTKADPRCTWVINGDTYHFCCPPCVDEFVRLAKEQPEQLKVPEFYVEK
jgi:YHS domain-containing protein